MFHTSSKYLSLDGDARLIPPSCFIITLFFQSVSRVDYVHGKIGLCLVLNFGPSNYKSMNHESVVGMDLIT